MGNNRKAALKKIANNLTVISWNIHDNRCHFGRKSDLPEFLDVIKDSSFFCLQETKGEVFIQGFKCYNKLRKGSRSGGTCIGVRRDLQMGVSQIKTTDDDFQAIRLSKGFFGLKRDMILVNVYNSPDNSSYKMNRHRTESTIDTLCIFLSTIAQSGDIIMAGDLNARIGLEPDYLLPDKSTSELESECNTSFSSQARERSSMDTKVNASGRALIELLISNNMAVLNGRTIGDINGAHTCLKYNGSSVVDYVAVSDDLLNQVKLFRCLDFSHLSDHKPIQVTLRLQDPRCTNTKDNPLFAPNPPRYKWPNDQTTSINFGQAQDEQSVKALLMEISNSDTKNAYTLNTKFTEALKTVASKSLQLKSTKKTTNKNSWFDWDCRLAKRALSTKANAYGSNPTDDAVRSEYFRLSKSYRNLTRNKKNKFMRDLNSKIENNSSLDWKAFKSLKSTKQDEDVFDNHDLYTFYKFYKDLYSTKHLGEDRINDIDNQYAKLIVLTSDELDQGITLTELNNSINNLKSGKSTASDLISSEMLKNLNSDFRSALLKVFNTCLANATYPWHNSIMTPLLKKGDKYDPDNYRSICVGSVLGKLYSNILLGRLLAFRAKHCPTPKNQLGFCKGARTTDHLLTLQTIVEKYCKSKKKQHSLFTCMVDFRKAFDTVCREALMLKIAQLGIGGKFLESLRHMYRHSTAQVKLIDRLSEVIDILIGTEQGHPMSPELFKVYIHELSELLDAVGVDVPMLNDVAVSHLLWADDLVLMALDQQGLQKLLDCLHNFCASWGLAVNPDKTKILIFNRSGKSYHSDLKFKFGDRVIQHTPTYCYLGIQLKTCGSFKIATEELRRKALRAYFGMKRTVDISQLSAKAICNLYDSLIKPILTYGCPLWLPSSNLFKVMSSDMHPKAALKLIAADPMERSHLQFLKWTIGVHKKASNIGSWGDTGRFPIGLTIISQLLSYFENIKSRGNDGSLIGHAFIEQENLGLQWYSSISRLVTHLSTTAHTTNTQNIQTTAHSTDALNIQTTAQQLFKQHWYEELCRQPKLSFYRGVKTEFRQEDYLSLTWGSRRALAKIRISAHPLGIETGRYSSDPDMYDRRCQMCTCDDLSLLRHLPEFDPVVESEWHLLCACPYYHDIRSELPGWILSELLQGASGPNLKNLFYASPLKDLGVFIRKALDRRKKILDSRESRR